MSGRLARSGRLGACCSLSPGPASTKRRTRRQGEPDRGATPGLALDPDLAAVGAHDLPGDVEAEPGAAARRRPDTR